MRVSSRFPFIFTAFKLFFVNSWQSPMQCTSSCHLSGLCCWCSGSVRLLTRTSKKRFLLPFSAVTLQLFGVFWLCCSASGCVSEAMHVLGDDFSCLSKTSIREVRVGMNLSSLSFFLNFVLRSCQCMQGS